jgi:acyl transferase domain-containing protein/acyl carrier protein
MTAYHPTNPNPIAIIGLGCRFPGAASPEEFWDLLRDGVDAITEIPAERWDIEQFYDPDLIEPGKMSTRWGGFIPGLDSLDADFFGLSSKEAQNLDPQQRLLLEVTWETLERAGIAPQQLAGSQTGVFVGIGSNDFMNECFADLSQISAYSLGNPLCIAVNRISHLLDLKGPSLGVDTGCSSSLVSIHLACQSLATGESDLAIAGGVNYMLSPKTTVGLSQAWMMALDGRCKSFDESADGFVRAEGCGMVLLKRLEDAQHAGDQILAVIPGSAVNHNGWGESLTAPCAQAQQLVVEKALHRAGLSPQQISFIEAHGVGSQLTDTSEAQALHAVFGGERQTPWWVGSVKTNIGHLELAAGIAGLIKLVLALQHQTIPPNLHVKKLNPVAQSLHIPTEAQPWPRGFQPRWAGVNSFGLGGTNAHVLVGDAPLIVTAPNTSDQLVHCFTLSAKSEAAFQALCARYREHFLTQPNLALTDVCHTVHVGRAHFPVRTAVVCTSLTQLTATLETITPSITKSPPNIAFLFSGQGQLYPGIGRELYEAQPIFRDALAQCDALLRPRLSLLAALYGDNAGLLSEPRYAQPALFALEYALAQLWCAWGVRPAAVMGYSLGEYVAACVAGVLRLEEALDLVAVRGQLVQDRAPAGTVVLILANREEIDLILANHSGVYLAAVHSLGEFIVAGTPEAMAPLVEALKATRMRWIPFNFKQPFHTPLLAEAAEGLVSYLEQVQFRCAQVPIVSGVTGTWVTAEELAIPAYWQSHLCEPVQFQQTLNTFKQADYQYFVEIGPTAQLATLGRATLPEATWLASLLLGQSDWAQMLTSLSQLYEKGVVVNWSKVDQGCTSRLTLPTYPFQRKRYWPDFRKPHAEPQVLPTQSVLLAHLGKFPAYQRREQLLVALTAQVMEALGWSDHVPIPSEVGFKDLGFTSLMAVEFKNQLQACLGQSVVLPATVIFDHSNLATLTDYIANLLWGLGREAVSLAGPSAYLPDESIAVIGLGCRFPGEVGTAEEFWQFLEQGQDASGEIPLDRWDMYENYDADPEAPGRSYIRHGAFLQEIDQFDPQFFGISPREAAGMDPQQRLMLEVSWEALEHAGQAPEQLAGSKTGVFVGLINHDYGQLAVKGGNLTQLDAYWGTGSLASVSAGRLAYTLGLQGPALVVDTACSSSLVAFHLACQSLRSGECRIALAGGVNIILSQETNIALSRMQAVAPDGRCKTFDAKADGYARGEGCGMVVLKRLRDAQADNDTILAVVRGSAVNHDGRSSGLTVPNGCAQQALLQEILASAQVQPAAISYIEAHGTGTKLGDPIEVNALAQVLSAERTQPLYIGSVKTNIGHLEAAAGIAGIIKVVLALQHEAIPPHLHFQEPNPLIDWEHIPINVPTVLTPWPRQQGVPRIAGISSFGMSGSNAHVLLEEAPVIIQEQEVATEDTRPHLLTLSARTQPALEQLAQRFIDFLHLNTHCPIADICYTALSGRSHFPFRLATTTASTTQLIASLTAFTQGTSLPNLSTGLATTSPKVAYLFSGQGSQYIGMGLELYHTQPVFQRALDQCNQFLEPHLGLSLLHLLTSPLLDETRFTQPALFALQYALTQMWHAWGVQPSAVIGHSVGEYAAACIAGVFSLEDGLKLITARARLMHALPQIGGMVAVLASETQVAAVLVNYPTITIAAINGPTSVVLSGEKTALTTVVNQLAMQGYKVKPLVVSHAFHSALMEPMLAEFTQLARTVVYQEPQLSLISNVTGALVADGQVSCAEYWVRHARAAVRFEQGMQTLWQAGYEVYLELGPAPVLLGMGKCCVPEAQQVWLPSLRKGRPEVEQALESLGALYAKGVKILWAEAKKVHKVSLPTYPFQRKRYWLEAPSISAPALPPTHQPLLGKRLRSALHQMQFESIIKSPELPFLADHRLYGVPVLPAAIYLEMVLEAAHQVFPGLGAVVIENFFIQEALVIPEGTTQLLQLVLNPTKETQASFEIYSQSAKADNSWTLYATGIVGRVLGEPPLSSPAPTSSQPEYLAAQLYTQRAEQGLILGSSMGWIERYWLSDGGAIGHMRPTQADDCTALYRIHPGLLDSTLQMLGVALSSTAENTTKIHVPLGLKRLTFYTQPKEAALWCEACLQPEIEPGDFIGSVRLATATGHILLDVEGLRVREVHPEALQRLTQTPDWLYELTWQTQAALPVRESSLAGSWLIFCDRQGVGAKLAELLTAQGGRCALVFPLGETVEPIHCLVDPTCPEAIHNLLQESIHALGAPFQGIIYLWGLDNPSAQTVCQSVLYLTQVLTTQSHQTQLWLATQGVHSLDHNLVSLNAAPLWGLGRVIVREHPEIWGGLLDFDPASLAEAAQQLYTELRTKPAEAYLAFRGIERFVARLQPSITPDQPLASLNADRTYLITGGLGGLGVLVAQWLVAKGARHLLLVGRSAPHPETQTCLAALERAGAKLCIAQVDITSAAAVGRLLKDSAREQPPLAGIFHAAGIVDDGGLLQQTWERFTQVLAPKISGAWNLHALTRHLSLDYFVLFSSAASLLGTAGQASYASGNAFMDSLAHHRRALGLPGLSINWGAWETTGMAAALDQRSQDRWQRQGVGVIPSETGLALLGRLLTAPHAQVAVLPIAWKTFLAQLPQGREQSLYSLLVPLPSTMPTPIPVLRQQLAATTPEQHYPLLLQHLQQLTARVLHLEVPHTLDPQQKLFEAGLDSLMAVELKNQIQVSLDFPLPATLVFDYPTIAALAQYILQALLPTQLPPIPLATVAKVEELDGLSTAEVEALMAAELADFDDLMKTL